jgi:hypothetical protein
MGANLLRRRKTIAADGSSPEGTEDLRQSRSFGQEKNDRRDVVVAGGKSGNLDA